jgi:glutamate dehydrogenase/leucine dehydrogenase
MSEEGEVKPGVTSGHASGVTVEEFYQRMKRQGLWRAYAIYRDGRLELSHPELMVPVGEFLRTSKDFAGHEAVFIGREDGVDTLFFAFVHCTKRGLAQGGLRFQKYDGLADLLSDGLRLAQGMTRKNALAGLWWGGGKGIMPLPLEGGAANSPDDRRAYFMAYGRFVASLNGLYYTAEDMGTSSADMEAVHCVNRFTTCIPRELGGSGNPSEFTALGVFNGMRAAWKFISGDESLEGVSVAVQGVGHVGLPLVSALAGAGARVYIADVPGRLEELRRSGSLPQGVVEVADPASVYALDVDIFSPCWRGAVINPQTIPALKARLVCGAANNILSDPADAERLSERGVEYVPDFVCNRMGIVNCADEWMGYLPEDVQGAAGKVYQDTLDIFERARRLGITTAAAADQLADEAAQETHPLFGMRGRRILEYLLKGDWAGVTFPALTAALGGCAMAGGRKDGTHTGRGLTI